MQTAAFISQVERLPSLGACVLQVVRFRLLVHRAGIGAALARLQHGSARHSTTEMAAERRRHYVERLSRRIAMVSSVLPIRAHCLEQSLATCYLARRCGIPVRFQIGVQPYGFLAHAWVELDGVPINESSEVVRQLAALPLET